MRRSWEGWSIGFSTGPGECLSQSSGCCRKVLPSNSHFSFQWSSLSGHLFLLSSVLDITELLLLDEAQCSRGKPNQGWVAWIVSLLWGPGSWLKPITISSYVSASSVLFDLVLSTPSSFPVSLLLLCWHVGSPFGSPLPMEKLSCCWELWDRLVYPTFLFSWHP